MTFDCQGHSKKGKSLIEEVVLQQQNFQQQKKEKHRKENCCWSLLVEFWLVCQDNQRGYHKIIGLSREMRRCGAERFLAIDSQINGEIKKEKI